ncbi:DUF3768 domain-containing protein [Sinorhizobium sp. M4_45]|uniref:DUF3768 domain-containing protein n=1 Tax=Sinorhizobium sp. M4_45 TaxID=2037901 RepID=UPI000C9C43B5|nr:DUF3768 domain-containing protein [Sinorhizobium sp. M4_45]PND28448.1 hypothetical protein CN933_05640 [Sinorhizobium sp. M4_45]
MNNVQSPNLTKRTKTLAASERIRVLNDWLRIHGAGGRVMMTSGIAALDDEQRHKVVTAIRSFDDFTEDNDPHGEHDCAVLEVDGLHVMFKIDYYDLTLSSHSPNPADPSVTKRLLTVMLADEY